MLSIRGALVWIELAIWIESTFTWTYPGPDNETQDNNCNCTGLVGSDGSLLVVRVCSAGYDSYEEECHESSVCDRDCDSNRQNRSHRHADSLKLWALKAYEDASKDKSQYYKSLHDSNLGEGDKAEGAEGP